jgi:hypothetical protein
MRWSSASRDAMAAAMMDATAGLRGWLDVTLTVETDCSE